MPEVGSVASALFAQMSKLLKTLTDEEIKLLATGEIKLSLVRPGYRVIEKSPALERTLRFMDGLTDDDVRKIEERQASLVVLRKGDTVISALDPRDIAAQVAAQSTEADMIRLLSSDSRLTAVNLKKVADALRIAVPPNVKAKTALQLYIAERVASDRGLRT
jgi:hypothetical protein